MQVDERGYQFAVQCDISSPCSGTTLVLPLLFSEVSTRLGLRRMGVCRKEDTAALALTGVNGFTKFGGRKVLDGAFESLGILLPKHAPE